jgi:hypothetical protein
MKNLAERTDRRVANLVADKGDPDGSNAQTGLADRVA